MLAMELYYSLFIGLLMVLAAATLMVGISNDAVNFLGPALGSKAAPRWMIFAVASAGILLGAVFGNDMMDVTRKMLFDASHFSFQQIMLMFAAVCFANVLLLDFFNTLGFPTSTTVTLIFSIIGATVCFTVLNDGRAGEIHSALSAIKTDQVLVVIFGIFVSIFFAFILGVAVQWFTRVVFSFSGNDSIKRFGALYGSAVITCIAYFLFAKQSNGTSLISASDMHWVEHHLAAIITLSFLFWFMLLAVMQFVFRINPFRFVVLFGTFAMAMAFAANDLVNFIGISVAGGEAYAAFTQIGSDTFQMHSLLDSPHVPTIYLLLAGMIMVLSLWFSKKMRTVIATSLNLSSQGVVNEQFGSSPLARTLVRLATDVGLVVDKATPHRFGRFVKRRFAPSHQQSVGSPEAPFDLIRASVSLLVSSVLIAWGTSLRLPLSTTYVTFIVAMATAMTDGAWNRETAVYRITGVIAIISGWFFSAFSAFIISVLFMWIVYAAGVAGIGILIVLSIGSMALTHLIHRRKLDELKQLRKTSIADEGLEINKRCKEEIRESLQFVIETYRCIYDALANEDRPEIRMHLKKTEDFNRESKLLKDTLTLTIKETSGAATETSYYYVQVVDYLREMAHCAEYIVTPVYEHLGNVHKPLQAEQLIEIQTLNEQMKSLFLHLDSIVKTNDFSRIDETVEEQQQLIENLNRISRRQIKRIKREDSSTKNSVLYFTLLHESKSIALHAVNMTKSYRDLVQVTL